MKKMMRLLMLMLFFVLMVSFSPTKAQAAVGDTFTDNGICYKVLTEAGTDNTVEVSTNTYTGSITIPSTVTVNGITYSVTQIGEGAFRNCLGVTDVSIPNTVTTIGKEAFKNCYGITNMTLPDSVTVIGVHAFDSCYYLKNINIPNNVITIDTAAFQSCMSLEALTIPKSVIKLGYYAFDGCSSLTSLTIPGSVQDLGLETFRLCTGLTSVTIESGVNKIPYGLFNYCHNLTSVTLPEGITKIDNFAFNECTKLSTIDLPDSLTVIYCAAFSGSGLTSITIPENVTNLDVQTFKNCDELTSVTFNGGSTFISYQVFEDCNKLANVIFNKGAYYIGNNAFAGCNSLTSINLQGRISEIGSAAFKDCSNLASVTFDIDLRNIDSEAFSGCSSLTVITLPSNLLSVGSKAFYNCSKLTEVYFVGALPAIEADAFDSGITIYNYCGISGWSDYSYSWNRVEKCTVTYNSLGGSPVGSVLVNKGSTVTKPSDPTKINDRFGGWYTSTEQKWNFSTDIVSENIVLYARWNFAPRRSADIIDNAQVIVEVGSDLKLDLSTIFMDQDKDALTYKVSVNGGTFVTTTENFTYPISAKGKTTLVFKANDGFVDSTNTYTLLLTTNHVPTAKSIVPNQVLTRKQTLTFAASDIAEDKDNDKMSITAIKTLPDSSVVKAELKGETIELSGLIIGSTSITVTVSDGTDTIDVEVKIFVNNIVPFAKSTVPTQSTLKEKSTVFNASDIAEDADGDSLTIVAVKSQPDSLIASTLLTGGTVKVTGCKKGNTTVTVTVSDGMNTADVTVPIMIVNTAPQANSSIADITVKKNMKMTYYADFAVRDIDSDALSITAVKTMPDSKLVTVELKDGVLKVTGVSKGSTSIIVTVSDKTETIDVEIPITVINTEPTSKVTVPTQGMLTGGTISLNAAIIAMDIDKDTLTITGIVTESNNTIATVRLDNGTVTVYGLSEGKTQVTVKVSDGTDEVNVTVPISVFKPEVTGNEGASGGGGQTVDNTTGETPASPAVDTSSQEGWDSIEKSIEQSTTDSINVDMDTTTLVPGTLFDELQGKDVTVTFQLAEGIEWVINGKDITGETHENIDLNVAMNSGDIPAELLSDLPESDDDIIPITLSHEGSFGFTAELNIDLDKVNAGRTANLYYYNPATDKLELLASCIIDSTGKAALNFTHASDYVILIDDGNTLKEEMAKISVTPNKETLYIGGTTGDSITLTTKLPDSLKELVKEKSLTISYESSKPEVATVSEAGVIKAKKEGKTTITITAKMNGVSISFRTIITVKQAYIKLVKSTQSLVIGNSFTFQAIGYGVETSQINWATTNKSVVVIDKNTGKATAKSSGTDYVVATVGNIKVKIKVTVTK